MTKIIFQKSGRIRCIYDDRLQFGQLGVQNLRRASHVEPKGPISWWKWRLRWRLRHIPWGKWYADLSPSRGPLLGPFDHRGEAIAAEIAWLEENWLFASDENS